jgi:hypothetical protein
MKIDDIAKLNLNDSHLHSIEERGDKLVFAITYILDYETQRAADMLLVFGGVTLFSRSRPPMIAGPDSFWAAEESACGGGKEYRIEMSTSGTMYTVRARSAELVPAGDGTP